MEVAGEGRHGLLVGGMLGWSGSVEMDVCLKG